MSVISRRVVIALAAFFMLAVPSMALAAGPTLTPQLIVSEGFESSPTANATLSWAYMTPGSPLPAYWGRVTQRRHSGSYGLWCAGTAPDKSAGWTKYAGIYPAGTAGKATIALPQLADYYSSTLDYWYDMPSIGGFDGESFSASWSRADTEFWSSQTRMSLVTTMTHAATSLSAPTPEGSSRPVNLSRVAGRVCFFFNDFVPGDFETEAPSNGEGASIDDVTISGFRFGPVRNLLATVSNGEVVLNWTTPAASTALLAPADDRPIAYRVWRSPDSQPYVWTEVTTDRIGGTTFTDPAPLDGASRYVVQAWEPGAGAAYGEVDLSAAAQATVIPPVPVTSITGVTNGATYTEMPAITVSRDTVKGMTYYRWDSTGSYIANSAQSFSVSPLEGTHTLEVYSTNTLGTPELPHKTLTLTVQLPVPPVAPVTSITVSGTTNSSGVYVTTPTITVTRDLPDGTTYYRWDAAPAFTTTTAPSFQLAAMSGTHTLEAYSSVPGAEETSIRSRTMTVNVVVLPPAPTKPSLSIPTISTSYPRRYRAFYIRGTVKPSHSGSTTVKLPLYRYYSGSYHFVKTYTVTLPKGATSYSLKLTLSKKSTYRVRSQHGCSVHISTYSGYKKFYVH